MIANATSHRLPFPDGFFHCVLGSPPYFGGIRQYHGEQETDWPEISYSPMPGLPPVEIPAQHVALGHERDPFAYTGHLVLIYRECRRVLRDDGVLVVNMGDVYTGGRRGPQGPGQRQGRRYPASRRRDADFGVDGIASKNLLLMPQRLALALQADGWILRSRMPGGQDMRPDVIWRSNKMPESVRDRPSKNFEDVFIFAKQRAYCWDAQAGRESCSPLTNDRGHGLNPKAAAQPVGGTRQNASYSSAINGHVITRNMRAAWTPETIERAAMRESWYIPSEPTSEEHWAAWPVALAARLIAVTTSEHGCCPECGAPWERAVESFRALDGKPVRAGSWKVDGGTNGAQGVGHWRFTRESRTLGWHPGCNWIRDYFPLPMLTDYQWQLFAAAAEHYRAERCRVLDPFAGIGRTWEACRLLGRRFFGADISLAYCLTARRRNGSGLPAIRRVKRGQASLFEIERELDQGLDPDRV